MISRATTPSLAAIGLTPNQVTALGLLAGLGAAVCFTRNGIAWHGAGALLFTLAYLFDYCDGELARMRGMSSRFGALFDDIVDGAVHCAFFLGLGYGWSVESGDEVWLWLGAAAAAGGLINAALPAFLGAVPTGETQIARLSDLDPGSSLADVLIFTFRGLARADFWLIVLTLALLGLDWLLLPAAAIGAQVYWILYLKKSTRRILT